MYIYSMGRYVRNKEFEDNDQAFEELSDEVEDLESDNAELESDKAELEAEIEEKKSKPIKIVKLVREPCSGSWW